jgi:hypothetical protein
MFLCCSRAECKAGGHPAIDERGICQTTAEIGGSARSSQACIWMSCCPSPCGGTDYPDSYGEATLGLIDYQARGLSSAALTPLVHKRGSSSGANRLPFSANRGGRR